MKNLILIISILTISFGLSAQTVVSGNMTGIWEPSDNPYIVVGDIYIVDSLIIEAGVLVQFQAGGWMIEVGEGDRFIANGTNEDPIVFEPYQGNEPGLWDKIYINGSGEDDTLKYCRIRNAVNGLYILNSNTVVIGCEIYRNTTGIFIKAQNGDSFVKIISCTFYNNNIGIIAEFYWVWDIADANIINSLIAYNDEFGVKNAGGEIGAEDILYNCFWGNGENFGDISLPTGFGSNEYQTNFNGDSCDVNYNIYYDPYFIDTTNSNFNLQPISKCIDAGTNLIFGQFTYDPDGTMPDMGANYYPHSNAAILAYSFPEQIGLADIDDVNQEIDIEVESGTDVTALIADFNLSGGATAIINGIEQISGETQNDFTFPVTYVVTADNGVDTQEWLVTVTVGPNNETDILAYSFPEQTEPAFINPGDLSVDIEVEYGTDVTDLIATFSLSFGATTTVEGIDQQSGVATNDFTNPVTYVVTAEDEVTVQNWVITVTIALPYDETDFLAYSFPEQTGPAVIDSGTHTVNIEVEYGTSLTDLIAEFTLSDDADAYVDGDEQISGETPNDFTFPVTYEIIAQDGVTVQEWLVTVDIEVGINQYETGNVKIYPNPFSNKTSIEFNNPGLENYTLTVFDITGNKVFEKEYIINNTIEFNRGDLLPGIYFVELKGEEVLRGKMIIE